MNIMTVLNDDIHIQFVIINIIIIIIIIYSFIDDDDDDDDKVAWTSGRVVIS